MPNNVIYSIIAKDKFSGVARKIASATKRVGKSLRKVGSAGVTAGRKVAGAFAFMKKGALSLMGTLAPLTTAFLGVAGAIKFATLGLGFEEQMAELEAITGITGDQLTFLGDEAIRIGKRFGVGASDVAESIKLIASANDELKDTKGALSGVAEAALLLKTASGRDLKESTDVLNLSLNQFNAEASRAEEFANVLAASTKVGAAEMDDLGSAIVKAGVAANLANINFPELNAAIQVLAKGGEKGQLAGTGLKGVFLKLDTVANRNLRPSVVGLEQALRNLNEILDQPGIDRNTALLKLFGLESIRAGGLLLKNVDLFARFRDEMTGTNVATEQANVRLRTLLSRLKILGARFGEIFLKTFERMRPQIDEMIVKFEKFLENLTKEDIMTFANGVAALAQSVVDIVNAAGKVGRFFTGDDTSGLSLRDRLAAGGGPSAAASTGTLDVKVALAGPKGAVDDVTTKQTSSNLNLRTGVQMEEQF